MSLRKVFLTKSAKETINLGRKIARKLKVGARVYLYGDLGSGKTTLAKGICRELGIKEEITSSSFVIVSQYQGKMPVCHIDLYRLDKSAIENLPLEEYFIADGVTIVEWAQRLATPLNNKGIAIYLKIKEKNKREIRIENIEY